MSDDRTESTFLEATIDAVKEEMRRDERVFAIGEHSGVRGGSFPIFRGIDEELGPERVIGTPICEGATVNTALGAAMTGLRPIVGLHFGDFMLRAIDEICDQVARARYTFGGQCAVPLVLRAFDGVINSAGTQHSGSYEAYFAHAPGLKVVVPSVPADAKGLLKSAVRDDNPVVFLEHKRLLNTKGPVPEGDYLVPLGRADVKRVGRDITILCYGIMVLHALAAADELTSRGIEAEVVDVRTLVPLDVKAIEASVRKTKHVIVAHEAMKRGGFGAELVATVAEFDPPAITLPIARVASRSVPVPFSPPLEAAVVASPHDLVSAVQGVLHR